VTGVSPERWGQFGKALQAWREDELEIGYEVRTWFAHDRDINLRLVQDLEKNYRPGTYTKWALKDAARAYKIPYEGPGSVLAFLHGETDTFARVKDAPVKQPAAGAVTEMRGLPPAPVLDPAREEAVRPYAQAIWDRYLDLPRRVTDPSGEQMFGEGTADAKTWDDISGRWDVPRRVWMIAELQQEAANPGRREGTAG
jgi:hypothetical protein